MGTNHLAGWLDHVPADPLNNIAAVWHSYDFNACNVESCWEGTVAPIAVKFPVIVTESGFKIDYVQKLWPWLEQNKISYMAWTWNTWKGEGLVTEYAEGTPSSPWGLAWKAQLEKRPAPPTPSPSPGCPGGSLQNCMNSCPPDAKAFKTCVADCEVRCINFVIRTWYFFNVP